MPIKIAITCSNAGKPSTHLMSNCYSDMNRNPFIITDGLSKAGHQALDDLLKLARFQGWHMGITTLCPSCVYRNF